MCNEIYRNINDFLYDYINIRDFGWFKNDSNNSGEVGLFLEKKLGRTGGDFCIPDYGYIEIKCLNGNKKNINLFSSAPCGKTVFPIQNLAKLYGWPDKEFKELKKINLVTDSITSNKFGTRYKSFLSVHNEKNVVLNIVYKEEIINNDVYWPLDELKEKIERKLSYLAVVTYYVRNIKNNKYFKYGHVDFYKLKDNYDLLNLFEKGVLKIKINYGVRKTGKYKGKCCDHGSTFFIEMDNINSLFDKINRY